MTLWYLAIDFAIPSRSNSSPRGAPYGVPHFFCHHFALSDTDTKKGEKHNPMGHSLSPLCE